MKTAVVILNWNGAAMLHHYLPSVVAHSDNAEVWVADNASTDDSMQVLRQEFPTVKTLVLDRNWGFAEGYNKALKQIDAEYYVLLNSDVQVTENWLAPLVAYMDENDDVAAVQPKVLKDYKYNENEDEDEDTFEYAGAAGGFIDKYGYPYCRGRLFGSIEKDEHQYDSPLEVHWATGCCMLIRSKDYWQVGGLDGRFFAHNEEIDLCWRLRIRGHRIMCIPSSTVYHLGGGTLPQGNPRKTYLNFRNNLTMLYKNLPEERLGRVMTMRLILDYVAAAQALVKGNTGDVKAIFKARHDYHAWRKEFEKDRDMTQKERKLGKESDLAPLSLLWQYYVRGIRKWSELPKMLCVWVLVSFFVSVQSYADGNSSPKTRGIGVYPGRQSESFATSVVKAGNEYRNLSQNHVAYHSSAYDYNLTAQLVTDGIIDTTEPAYFEAYVNGELLPKREREWAIDCGPYSGHTINGENISLNLRWQGMSVDADSVDITYTYAYNPAKATKGYEIMLTNGLEEVAYESGVELPGKEMRFRQHSDPNKQSAQTRMAVRNGVLRYSLSTLRFPLSALHLMINLPGASFWRITAVQLYKDGKVVDTPMLPSTCFRSMWMSEFGGEQWVYVDLGAEATIEDVALHWLRFAPQGKVEVSDDAANWKEVGVLPENKGLSYKLGVHGKGRYVRLHLDGSRERYVLSEMQVFGRGGTVASPSPANLQSSDDTQYLNGGDWRIQRSSEVTATGSDISSSGFSASDWIPATVPGTVLMSYVNAGAVPDQNYDENILYTSDSFFYSNFWYRREFVLPESFAGKKVFLNLDGINWKANLWVNGHMAGRVEGAFMRGRVDISPYLHDGTNVLAIEIERVAHPAAVKEKNEDSTDYNGGLLGADNPTFHATVGWDWISTVRGRDAGVWNDVFLTAEESVTLANPLVSTSLNLPDTLATLTPTVCVYNNVERVVRGTLRGWIGDITFEKTVEIQSGAMSEISFDAADFAQLRNQRMNLWWPKGYGEPYLYDAGFAFVDEQGKTLSTKKFKQGIRQMTYMGDKEGCGEALRLYCNGRRIVPLGGNWGFSEHNLNYRGREYDIAVRNHRDMNFNMIRNWVGQTGDEEFYEACDKYGVMVWQDFWLANPSDGPDPYDNSLFLRNAEDYLLKIRHHAAIALYCGRNEGYPPKEIDTVLREYVATLHPGIVYIPSSADDVVSGHGPYNVLPAKDYFERQTGKLHSERGMPNVMNIESLARTLHPEHLWPQSNYWGQHDFTLSGAQRGSTFNAMVRNFGEPSSAEEYTSLAQFVNYDGYRAMYEACNKDRMGLIIWMSHACWPSMVWQCYDYYFEPTAAWFGCRKGCEPLHIQYNALTKEVEVANHGVGDYENLSALIEVYSVNGRLMSSQKKNISSPNDSTIPVIACEAEDCFLRLTLSQGEHVLSENTYLLPSADGKHTGLQSLPKATIEKMVSVEGNKAIVTVKNRDTAPAMLLRLNLREENGEQILPVHYSDNYFHLMPGEERTVVVTWDEEDQHTDKPTVDVIGYNVDKK